MTVQFLIDGQEYPVAKTFRPEHIALIPTSTIGTGLGFFRHLAYREIPVPDNAQTLVIKVGDTEHPVAISALKQRIDDLVAETPNKAGRGLPFPAQLREDGHIDSGVFERWFSLDDASVVRRVYRAQFRPERLSAATQEHPSSLANNAPEQWSPDSGAVS